MKCPHCLESFHESWTTLDAGSEQNTQGVVSSRIGWNVRWTMCPACHKATLELTEYEQLGSSGIRARSRRMIRPKIASRIPLPAEVPAQFSADYLEACAVLADSPKACSALGRRCLQHLLREKGGFEKKDLFDQIQDALDSKSLPSDIAADLDTVRVVGNFAAHTMKSTNSGEVLEVEPGEAEWNLEVIEQLFDFYFVRPEVNKRRRQKLNEKLAEAGKPPLREE